MKIKWLGHACFLLTSDDGTRVVTDPYKPGAFGLDYGPPAETADVVTVSHEHDDHNNVAAVKGNPQVVRGAGVHKAKGIEFKGVSTSHDEASGAQRGSNTVYCFSLDGVRVCHLGDLGHKLSDKTIGEIGPVDVLLVPVGGNFTIDARGANGVVDSLRPKIVIPMHFQNERCPNFPVATVEGFQKLRQRAPALKESEIEVKKEKLPPETETVVLKPAC
ncbi:MAG TPA: MBL fold metallo-hydrolase [Dehalococcoidia bacterium]|nr:MBL fold metallo-hydrolase [Dehalococcoidia bacterium]